MTILWTADELTRAIGVPIVEPIIAAGVSIDTRTLRRGDLFIALIGENGDGHAYVETALAKGAAGALVHRELPGVDRSKLLLAEDTLAALGRLGAFARARFGGRVIAVTGSVGKTTTKEMLRRMLSAQGTAHIAEASYNNHWGVPLTLARLPADADFCVVEIGMNHPGEIAPLARLTRPHVALITAIERAHVGHMGSIEAVADEKASILRGLEPGGAAVLPLDSPMFPRLRDATEGARVTTFGSHRAADARLIEMQPDADGSFIRASISAMDVCFRLNAPGRHMSMNAVAALAAASALGLNPAASARTLEGFAPLPGRGNRRRIAVPGGSALLLDESYNASAASVRAALAVLRLQPARRRLAVLGDMLELGDEGPSEHAALVPDVASNSDLLFACGPLMRRLFDAVPPEIRATHTPDSESLAPIVSRSVSPGDAILVKGSLGSRMKLVVAALDKLAEAH
jgi:UDP-N-acetylmuramoyl-tripeptide--D-alanyl-D-alanine ligase